MCQVMKKVRVSGDKVGVGKHVMYIFLFIGVLLLPKGGEINCWCILTLDIYLHL